MASLNDAQAAFYTSQKIKYNEIEPNRFLDNNIKGVLPVQSVGDMLANFTRFDPYTQRNESRLSATSVSALMQGQSDTTAEERACRQYVGLNGLDQLMRDTANQPNAPIRCGWRYKKSPDGIVPEVSNGALGTRNGPLNVNSRDDEIKDGVQWIWNLDNAKNTILRDSANTYPTPELLDIVPSVGGGQFNGRFAWCETSKKIISVDQNGRPTNPADNCPADQIYTDASKVPKSTTNTNIVSNLAQQSIANLQTCSRPGNNIALSRDCLLLAITNNGCSDKGSLYQSLALVNPNESRWDSFIRTQSAFNTYQSSQGGNGITASLFEKDRGTWETAIRDIVRLQNYATIGNDPTAKIAARDLCTRSGEFDTYDFCVDVTDNTPIGNVQVRCLQNHWQEMNGKPAGLAYPKSGDLDPILQNPRTWGGYKQAVANLKATTINPDPVKQREAVEKFYGVPMVMAPFSPDFPGSMQPDKSPPCMGLGRPSADGAIRLYNKAECDSLRGTLSPNGECLKPGGGTFSWDCRYLNGRNASSLALWIDASNMANFQFDRADQVYSIDDAGASGRMLIQPNGNLRPRRVRDNGRDALYFEGGRFLSIPNANALVANNYTVFIVARRVNPNAQAFITCDTVPSVNVGLYVGMENNYPTFRSWGNDLNGTPLRGSALGIAGDPIRILCFKRTSNGREIYVNGAINATDRNTARIINWNNARLGGTWFTGWVYDFLFYTTDLALDEQRRVEGYLAHKWNLVADLDPGHPFKQFKP